LLSEEKNNDIEETPAEEAATEETPAEEAATGETPAEEAATEETPAEEAATGETPAEENLDSIKLDFIIGKKIGMTTIFSDNGTSMPVTIIEAGPCKVVQIKSEDKDGYSALQIGFGENKSPNKPISGHFKNANIKDSLKVLKEFKSSYIDNELLGKEITVNSFNEGDKVTVTGKSKGKGFAGHMKRHNFSGGRASHGKNSVMRKPGSVGAGTWPGRIWPGTKMAGRMGGDNVTVENLKVLKIDNEKNLLFIKGAVPGPSKSILYIQK
jgi:large subunit ribosomal protein L3